MTKPIAELQEYVAQTRRDIVRMVHGVQSGHPGGSLGCAEFFTVLYQNVLRHNSENFNMDGSDEDVFILSNGHISPVYYSALAHSGYFPVAELATFRKLNTRLQGHPTTHEGLPGVRIASGSLGQGLSVDGQITNINKAGEKLLGHKREEAIQVNIKDLVHPEDAKRSLEYLKKLDTDGYYSGYEGRIIAADGLVKEVEVNSTAILED